MMTELSTVVDGIVRRDKAVRRALARKIVDQMQAVDGELQDLEIITPARAPSRSKSRLQSESRRLTPR